MVSVKFSGIFDHRLQVCQRLHHCVNGMVPLLMMIMMAGMVGRHTEGYFRDQPFQAFESTHATLTQTLSVILI